MEGTTTLKTMIEAHCLGCGYALRSLLEPRCPECGRGFDPSDPATVNLGKPFGCRVSRLLGPTNGLARFAPKTACCVVALCLLSLQHQIVSLAFLFWTWLIFIFPYAIRGSCRNWLARRYRQPKAIRSVDRSAVIRINRWFGVLSLLTLIVAPLSLPFQISRPWLSHLAAHEYADVPIDSPKSLHWAGLFPVIVDKRSPGGITMFIGVREVRWSPENDPNGQWPSRNLTDNWIIHDDDVIYNVVLYPWLQLLPRINRQQ